MSVLLISIALNLLVPMSLSAWAGFVPFPSRRVALLRVLIALLVAALVAVVVPWAMLCVWLRPLPLLAALASVPLALRRRPRPVKKRAEQIDALLSLACVLFFAAVLGCGLWGWRVPSQPPVALAFPLRGGTFCVGHGGSTAMLNAHHDYGAQRWALDILALGPSGRSSLVLAPGRNEDYAAFGLPVYAPCAGAVVEAHEGDADDGVVRGGGPGGNHLVLRCAAANVRLAHLRRGSLMVKLDDTVSEGQLVGRVGDSGNSSEPHLHVQAETSARVPGPVPALFDGRWLVRNSLISVEKAGDVGHEATFGGDVRQ